MRRILISDYWKYWWALVLQVVQMTGYQANKCHSRHGLALYLSEVPIYIQFEACFEISYSIVFRILIVMEFWLLSAFDFGHRLFKELSVQNVNKFGLGGLELWDCTMHIHNFIMQVILGQRSATNPLPSPWERTLVTLLHGLKIACLDRLKEYIALFCMISQPEFSKATWSLWKSNADPPLTDLSTRLDSDGKSAELPRF